MKLSRRSFLGSSVAAVLVAGTRAKGRVFGANDRVAVACIGIRGQGNTHIGRFAAHRGAQVAALCDVDREVLVGRTRQVERQTQAAPKQYMDLRDVLADDKIDAVSIATPNHWHSLATIWACQAGKDVYIEKPLSHNVWEGRQVVAAARQYGRVVMHGTQRRSDTRWLKAVKLMREGVIGQVYMARALCYKNRNSIGFKPDQAPPENLRWDLWQGPAQERPYSPNYVHYNWHWFWDYGNGDIGNQGVHQMDVAIWGIDKGLPVEIYSTGGRYTYEDQAETPNTQVCTFRYADGTMTVFEVRGRATNDEAGTGVGNLFYGSEGYFAEGAGFAFFNNSGDKINADTQVQASGSPYENFIAAVRSRREEDNFADPLGGHIGSAHCHLANISYRLGRSLRFDPANERFIGDQEANAMLTRDYRPGFEVPALA